MATYLKLTVKQYANLVSAATGENAKALAGIVFEYTGGTGKTTAVQLMGDAFTPEDATATSVYRVYRNAIALFWVCRRWEMKVRENGVSSFAVKLRDKPTAIKVYNVKGELMFQWNSIDSIVERAGLVPNRADLEAIKLPESLTSTQVVDDNNSLTFNAWELLSKPDRQKINRAASISFNALRARFDFEEKPEEEKTETPEKPKKGAKK